MHLLLCTASFTDIKIKHPPNKRYWIGIVVDGTQVFESQKRDPGSSASWKEKKSCSFPFLPTSTLEVSLFQKDWRHPIGGVVLGRFKGRRGEIVDFLDQNKAIHLEDLNGRTSSTTITINFSLVTEAAEFIMMDLSRIRQSKSDLVQEGTDLANEDSSNVNTLSTYIETLGDALLAMATIRDSTADVGTRGFLEWPLLSSPYPILKVAWIVLLSVYEAVNAQDILDEKVRDLLDSLKEMLFVAKKVPDLFLVDGTENIIDEIGKAAVEVATLTTEYIKSSSFSNRMSHSLKGRIDSCQNRCKSLQKMFNRRIQVNVAHNVELAHSNRIALRDFLACDLAYVRDANWSSELCCLAGTREEPIKQILTWIHNADPSKSGEVLLVAEVAGAGKSALAHSIGQRCQEKGLLTTSFFFQRDSAEYSTPVKFISTLALDLSCDCGSFAQRVSDIIQKERGVASKFSYRQFKELILTPSSLLSTDKPLVVIIDALDECAEHLNVLLQILRDGVPQLPGMFRFLVTSRPSPDLDEYLSGQPHVCLQSLYLNQQSNRTDLCAYISHSLVEIFPKGKEPDPALVEAFSLATEGLFLRASIILSYLRGVFKPEAALRRILDENHPEQLSTEARRNRLYTNIMERHDWRDLDFVQAYLAVMGMVLTAKEPLPISVLVSLNPAISLEISDVLGHLRAVLHYLPEEPIRVLHRSFHDFVVNCSPDLPYHINIAEHEQQMAILCLDILNRELKTPIPGTGYLVDNASLLKGIPCIPDENVSEGLWYSCQFVINHCISMSDPSAISAAVQELIEKDFVPWIEICASKGSFTGVDPRFLAWLKSVLPDVQKMVYSIPHLAALRSLSERLRHENRHNEALLVMQSVVEQQMATGDPATQLFHSTILPNLQVSVYCALSTFETGISPWMNPSAWLDANTKNIRAIFDGIVGLTANKTVIFPATMIYQRLTVYILAYTMLRSRDEIYFMSSDVLKSLSGELDAILKRYQDRDIVNQMRSHGKIKNELLILFRNASREHHEMQFEDLLNNLLALDSIALSANIEALITDEEKYEELAGTTGAGAQTLVNLLHARLDFPMDSGHKRLLVSALTHLSERSGCYPESLTLNNVTPERGRRATGGFADVYKGKCFGEEIALKVFKIPLRGNSLNSWRSSDARFQNVLREVITWRQLSHPNVLPFYGVHFLEEPLEIRFCLVSPWMENGNVVEFLARQNRMAPYTDTTNCVCLALDIAQGVQYLHSEKIVHRDLKGYNILISPSRRAYIADFGLATFTDSGSATTLAASAIMGSLKWLAPELMPHAQVSKRHHTYASDMYAFALVCYEMFSGKLPFEDVEGYDLKLLLERETRPILPADDLSRRRGLSHETKYIIRDCWAQEPTARPSADIVVKRLQLLQPAVDERPLNGIGTSFFTQLLQDQVDNPFAILSREYNAA